MPEKTFDCYKCKHRRRVPGDCHSRCAHPTVGEVAGDAMSAIIGILSGVSTGAASVLNIQGDRYGISKGWFLWPYNFDPVWLRNCEGFELPEKNGG